jgi:hypothetical protein
MSRVSGVSDQSGFPPTLTAPTQVQGCRMITWVIKRNVRSPGFSAGLGVMRKRSLRWQGLLGLCVLEWLCTTPCVLYKRSLFIGVKAVWVVLVFVASAPQYPRLITGSASSWLRKKKPHVSQKHDTRAEGTRIRVCSCEGRICNTSYEMQPAWSPCTNHSGR